MDVVADVDGGRDTALLLSICNVGNFPRPSSLIRMDLATHHKEYISIGDIGQLVNATGLFADDEFVYHVHVAQEKYKVHLSILDRKTLDVISVHPLPEVRDCHSVLRVGDEIFVVSTETDQVLAYPIKGMTLGSPREVWSPTGSGMEMHHVNSLAYTDGHVYCSAFGPRNGTSWSTAHHGYVRDLTEGVNVLEGLRHPHSAIWHDGELFYCNSLEGTVNVGDEVVAYLSGYSRGLGFGSDGTIYVGTSLARKPPADSTGTDVFRNPSDKGDLHGQCAVIQMSRDGTNRLEIPIPPFGNEIYDILVL